MDRRHPFLILRTNLEGSPCCRDRASCSTSASCSLDCVVGQYLVEAVHEVLVGKLFVSPRAAAGLAKRAANPGLGDLTST